MNNSSDTYITLDAWRESGKFFAEEKDAIRPSDGKFEVRVAACEINYDEEAFKNTEGFKQAVNYTVENQQKIADAILAAIRKEYDKTFKYRDDYFEPDEVDIYMPQISSNEELRDLISPLHIFINVSEKDGHYYIGYEFDCSWEQEHGLGVLMYKTEVDKAGFADVAFTDEHYWDTHKPSYHVDVPYSPPKMSDEDQKLLMFLLEDAQVNFDISEVVSIEHVKFESWGAGDMVMDLYELSLRGSDENKRVNRLKHIATYQKDHHTLGEADLEELKAWAQAEDAKILRVDEPEGDSCMIAEVTKPGSRAIRSDTDNKLS